MSCEVVWVKDPQGNRSQLFDDLVEYYEGNEGLALQTYLEHRTETSEPRFDEIVENGGDFAMSTDTIRRQVEERIIQTEFAIGLIRRNFSNHLEPEKEQFYTQRIEQLRSHKDMLSETLSLQGISEVADKQLSYAETLLGKPDVRDHELMLAMQLVDSWKSENTFETLEESEISATGDIYNLYSDIDTRAARLEKLLINILRKSLLREINNSRPNNPITMDDLLSSRDDGFIDRLFGDISKTDSPLVQLIDRYLKTAKRNQSGLIRETLERIDENLHNIDTDKFIQRDEKGKRTGNFISQFSHAYYNAITAATKRLKSTLDEIDRTADKGGKKRAAALRNFYTERNKVEVAVDVRFFNNDKHSTNDYKTRADYEEHLKKQLGDDYQSYVDDAIDKHRKYEEDKSSQEEYYQNAYSTGEDVLVKGGKKEKKSDYIVRKMRSWELLNNPDLYLAERYGNPSTYSYTRGYRYVVTAARKFDDAGNATEFYDSAFADLTSVERKAYDFIMDLMSTMKDNLPYDALHNIHGQFIPSVTKSLMEKIKRSGITGAHGVIGDWFIDELTENGLNLKGEDQRTRLEVDPNTGEVRKRIPINFLNNLEEEERSYDMNSVLKAFSAMAINYRYMSDVENKVLLGYRLLRESDKIEMINGQQMTTRQGLLKTRKGLNNLVASTKYSIDAMLYGNKRENTGATNFEIFGGPLDFLKTKLSGDETKREKSRAIRRVARYLEKMKEDGPKKEYLDAIIKYAESSKDIPEDTKRILISFTKSYENGKNKPNQDYFDLMYTILQNQYDALEGKRLSMGKVGDMLLTWTQLKGMGWNLTSGINNIGFGFISNIVHAGSGKDFTIGDWGKALPLVANQAIRRDSKLNKLLLMYDILFEVSESAYGEDQTDQVKAMSKAHPYYLQKAGEKIIQGSAFVAMMNHKKLEKDGELVLDENGQPIALWDTYDDNGVWREDLGKAEDYGFSTDLGATDTNNFTRLRDRIIQTNKRLHGNYDPNSPVEMKKWVAGRALLQFRSWMYEGFKWRFERERYDDQLGEVIKGRYVSVKDISQDYGLFAPLKAAMQILAKKEVIIDGERISELDKQNLKASMWELVAYLGMMSAMIMLKAGLSDDDDEENYIVSSASTLLLNSLYRVQSDITFYLSPTTFEQILSNPVAAIKTLQDVAYANERTWDYLFSDDDYRGKHPAAHWLKNVPMANQVGKVMWMSDNLIEDKF